MFGDRHMDNRKYNYYCDNCRRSRAPCDDMDYLLDFRLEYFISTKISLSNDYMRKPGGHAYFGFTQSWSYSLLEKFPQIKGRVGVKEDNESEQSSIEIFGIRLQWILIIFVILLISIAVILRNKIN